MWKAHINGHEPIRGCPWTNNHFTKLVFIINLTDTALANITWYLHAKDRLDFRYASENKRVDLFDGPSVEDGFGEENVLLASSK